MRDTKIQWHPGFVAAMNLEFAENRNDLIFEKEYNLNTKPLEIDLLIIRKNTLVPISNEIGTFFRGHNIIEYKSPEDSLNIDVFYKSMAYAGLYKSYGKSVDERKADDITVSIIRESQPRALFSYFREHGYVLANPVKGIYYLEGNVLFPTQLIVTNELGQKSHAWLKALSGSLKKEDIRNLLDTVRHLKEASDRELADSILEVSIKANMQIVQELMGDGRMYETLLEIMEPQLVLRDKEKQEEWLKKGEFKTLYGLVRDNLISIESAAARQNLTVEEFQAKLRELDII